MAEWWEQYPTADSAGGTATAETGGNWWEQYRPAETPELTPEPGGPAMRTETLPGGKPFEMAEGTSFDELMQTAIEGQPAARQANIDQAVGELPDDATELEMLDFYRRKELISNQPNNDLTEFFRAAYENETDPEKKRERLIDFQIAQRRAGVKREMLDADRTDIAERGISVDQKLMEERAKVEAGLGPDMALANAPIMRGATTGVANAASNIAETALRILPGDGAPSQLADKIGRQRAAEGQYQSFQNEKQGTVPALLNEVTQMTGEYLPLAASGVPAWLQVGAKGANDAYLKSDDDTYALTSAVVQGALTYAGGKLAGGTFIDMLSGKVAGKALGPMLKGFGMEGAEELGQLYGQAMIDRGFGVGDGRMPTVKDAVWTLAVVAGARGVGTAMSAGIEDDGVNQPSLEGRAFNAVKEFADRKWPSRKAAQEAGVDQVATTAKERSDLARDIRNRLTADQFTEQLRTAATSPEEADALLEIYRARASSAGETFDDYVGKRIKGVEKTTRLSGTAIPTVAPGMVRFYHGGADQSGKRWFSQELQYAEGYARKSTGAGIYYLDLPENHPLLRKSFDDSGTSMKAPYSNFEAPEDISQQAKLLSNVRPDGRRGEIEFLAEGPAILRAFETQSVATLAHETGHLFRRDLLGDDLKIAEQWAGAREGKWNKKAEEKFARGFENYLATGEAPTKRLSTVFAKFKDWLAGVYGAIKGTAIDVNISPEMRGVFDRLLTPSDMRTDAHANGAHVSPEIAQTPENAMRTMRTESAPISPDILSQDLADRFRGLANQTALPEARAANYEADVAMGFPERKTWAEAEERAAQRIKADPTGELSRVIERIDQANATGGVINLENQEETALVNRLSDMLATDLANPESRAAHRKLRFAFREARSEQARALGYRDPLAVMEPAQRARKSITDAIAEPTPEETAERKAARTPEQHAEVDRKMEERYNRAKEQLAKQGIDLDDIESITADPKKAMVVLDHLRAGGKWSDVLFEYWRNSILSGPTTQATNVIGNTVFGAWNLGPERAAEAAVNLFARNKKAASFGEFRYLLGGVLPGVMRGLKNARTSWSLETSALAEELGRDGAFKIDGPRGAIKGKMGRLVRAMGYRPLLAADEFAKSVVVTMEVGAHAYRNGQSLGLEGDELQTFIQQQTDDLGSASWSQAFGKAEELTFQGQRGLVAQKIAGGGHKLRQFKGARWVLPFVETPAAIFEQGIKRTPILGAILDYAEARRSGMNLVDAGMTPTIARQLIAFGGLALLWDAVSGDEPWLTGADTIADPKNRDVSFRARPPMSIRLGDQWYSYARIEPFATAIATTADAVKGIQDGKYHKPVTGLVQQAKEKSYLDGLGDAIDAVQGAAEGDLSATEQWGSKFAASWVPNLYRQTVRSAEGEMDENRMWGKGLDRFERFVNRTAQQAQLPLVDSQPRFDVWGRPISYNDMGDSPATSFAFRLFSPVKAKDLSTVEQADLALIRWNEKNPDNQELYSEVQKYVTIGGETQYLTDEQHAQYAQIAGEQSIDMVAQLDFNPDDPTADDIRKIKAAITKARKMTRENLLPTWTFD